MTRQQRRRRQAGRTAPRSASSRALPFAVGLGVATVVALIVVFAFGRGGASEPTAAAVIQPSSGSAQAASRASPTPTSMRQAELLALGQRLVLPAGEREGAAAIRLSTASFGDGSVFDLAQERGNVVVIFFMAAWCTTCFPEAQALAQIHETYAEQGVRVLILDVDTTEDEADLADFRQQTGNGEHLWAMDVAVAVAQSYRVLSLDTTIFIDREGRVAYSDGSPTSYDVLAAVIEALL